MKDRTDTAKLRAIIEGAQVELEDAIRGHDEARIAESEARNTTTTALNRMNNAAKAVTAARLAYDKAIGIAPDNLR